MLVASIGGEQRWSQSPHTTFVYMNCYDNLISIRGLCEPEQARFYLDDYGMSLRSISKIADERFVTGKRLVSTIIERAWRDVLRDIRFDGFKSNLTLTDSLVGVVGTSGYSNGLQGILFTLDKSCTLGRFFVSSIFIHVKTGGSLVLTLIEGASTTTLYNDAVSNETIYEIRVGRFVSDSFSLMIDTTNCEVYRSSLSDDSCGCDHYAVSSTEGGNGFGIQFQLQVRCDIEKHLCKFVDVIATAVIYKSLALLWHEAALSTRLNDFLTLGKKEEAYKWIGYYDSSLNVFKYDENKAFVGGTVKVAQGQYQLELEKIKLPVPKCRCCMECDGNNYSITIP